MDTLKAMAVFVRCVELGSLSAAAKALGTTQPTVSKAVAALESRLGGPLFVRSRRGLVLTAGGERYCRECKQIVSAVDGAQQTFVAERESVVGTVIVAASAAFGRTQIIPRLPALMQQYPQLRVELKLGDKFVDLAAEGVDVAFRVAELRDSGLWVRRVGTAARVTVGSQAYFDRHGMPERPRNLEQHECIYFEGINAPRVWTFARMGRSHSVRIGGRFQTNTSEAVREAALVGLGIALLPRWMVAADVAEGRLITALTQYQPKPLPVYAVSTLSSRHAAKVKAVMDFFQEALRDSLS